MAKDLKKCIPTYMKLTNYKHWSLFSFCRVFFCKVALTITGLADYNKVLLHSNTGDLQIWILQSLHR